LDSILPSREEGSFFRGDAPDGIVCYGLPLGEIRDVFLIFSPPSPEEMAEPHCMLLLDAQVEHREGR